MIFTINKTDLQVAIAAPARLAAKSLSAHTSCVLVVADADQVTFEATDQTESARCSQIALIEQPGRTLIPANSLSSIIKTLPDEAVTISSDGSTAHIECGMASFDIPALSPNDFPGFPSVDASDSVTVPFELFASMAKAAYPFAAKKTEARDNLKGVYIEYDGAGCLMMTATDSYHIIRVVERSNDISGSGGFSALVPSAFMAASASAKFASEAVLSVSDKQVQVTCGNTTLITRTINERYPSVDQFFNCEQNARAEFIRDELLGTIKRAVAVSSRDHIAIKIYDGHLDVSLCSSDRGSMHECLDVATDGMCTASLGSAFLLDALSAIDSDTAEVILENPLKPIILKGASTSCVVMPIRK
ncbi:DNA polymerase III subunit beta [Gordonibacter sp.]|uniref:DNA polymerase III subunit beta n=1 Tax=Gordonibacter sp. TaxID=1968902 RepID=UPI002FCA4300